MQCPPSEWPPSLRYTTKLAARLEAPAPLDQQPAPAAELSKREKNMARLVQWRKDRRDVELVAVEDIGLATYLVQKSQIVSLMTVEVPRQCKCRTRNCTGSFQMAKCTTVGHGGSMVMWFRCDGHACARTIVFNGSESLNLDRTFTASSNRYHSAELVGFMEVVISLMNGELFHAYEKATNRRGANAYGATYFNDIIAWLYPYVETVLDRQCDQEIARMKVGATSANAPRHGQTFLQAGRMLPRHWPWHAHECT